MKLVSLKSKVTLQNFLHQHQLKLFPFSNLPKHIHTSTVICQNPQATHIRVDNSVPVHYSKLLSKCNSTKSLSPGMQIHAHVIKFELLGDTKVWNFLISLYSKCRIFGYARKLLDQSFELDLVSWSALISGYVQNGLAKEALSAFHEMHLLGVKCNQITFPSVLKACAAKKDLRLGMQVHGIVGVTGFEMLEFLNPTEFLIHEILRINL